MNYTIIDAGCDWLSNTTGQMGIAERWNGLYTRVKISQIGDGKPPRFGKLHGYQGEWVDGWFFGQRSDGWFSQMSSETAREHWWSVARLGGKATRFDSQVTYRVEGDIDQEMRRLLLAASEYQLTQRHPMEVKQIGTASQVETIYIGSRKSAVFGRIYNKHRESDNPYYQNGIRFEVQANGDTACQVVDALRASGGSLSELHYATVDWFSLRGVTLPRPGPGTLHIQVAPRGPTTLERRLAYLATHVAPMVARTVEEAGLLRTLDALLCRVWKSHDMDAILEAVSEALHSGASSLSEDD